jgi:hypothetical protein
MMSKQWTWAGAIVMIVLAAGTLTARVKVQVEFDKSFDFGAVRTWAWASEMGQVFVARTKDDSAALMKKRAEPIIVDAVGKEMPQRKLTAASGGAPDVAIAYYLLLATSMDAQMMGQFLPAVGFWGLPPFQGATQSLEMMNAGTLVLDFRAKDSVVWRGVARAELAFDATDEKREKVLREAVRDLLRRFPPKK